MVRAYSRNHATKLVLLRNKEEKKFSIKLKITKEQNKGNDKYNKYKENDARVRIRANYIFLKFISMHTRSSLFYSEFKKCACAKMCTLICALFAKLSRKIF